MIYSSVENKKIKNLKKLAQKKYRNQTDMFLVETPNLIKEAYEANILKEILVLENTETNIKIQTNEVTKNVMRYLSQLENPSTMIGVCQKPVPKKIKGKILVLDNIQDPGNLGTIIRTAVAFNIDTIIVSEQTVDIYNSKTIRASEGMAFKINIVVQPLKQTLEKLKENGYKIYGTTVTCTKELKTIEKNEKFVIIMGNEGNGITESLLKLCDEYLYIPMNKKCESLNVAVATGIILYEISR